MHMCVWLQVSRLEMALDEEEFGLNAGASGEGVVQGAESVAEGDATAVEEDPQVQVDAGEQVMEEQANTDVAQVYWVLHDVVWSSVVCGEVVTCWSRCALLRPRNMHTRMLTHTCCIWNQQEDAPVASETEAAESANRPLTEEEKIARRAQRFGATNASAQGVLNTRKQEGAKAGATVDADTLKRRAERFGLPDAAQEVRRSQVVLAWFRVVARRG